MILEDLTIKIYFLQKLTKTYNKSKTKYKYLDDMIKIEMEEDSSLYAIDALLWLKRYIHNLLF